MMFRAFPADYEKIGNWERETEYRINKKGCEYFRSGNLEYVRSILGQLQEKRPGVYTMQARCRDCHRSDRGAWRPWSPWREIGRN